jgi:hypothetical protein
VCTQTSSTRLSRSGGTSRPKSHVVPLAGGYRYSEGLLSVPSGIWDSLHESERFRLLRYLVCTAGDASRKNGAVRGTFLGAGQPAQRALSNQFGCSPPIFGSAAALMQKSTIRNAPSAVTTVAVQCGCPTRHIAGKGEVAEISIRAE